MEVGVTKKTTLTVGSPFETGDRCKMSKFCLSVCIPNFTIVGQIKVYLILCLCECVGFSVKVCNNMCLLKHAHQGALQCRCVCVYHTCTLKPVTGCRCVMVQSILDTLACLGPPGGLPVTGGSSEGSPSMHGKTWH